MGASRSRPKKPAPARRKPGPKPPRPEHVARILVDAEHFGERYAAKRHRLSERTVFNYRRRYANDTVVAELCTRFRNAAATGWIDQARAARRRLTQLVLEAAESPEATLREKTDALRRLSELLLSNEIISDTDGDDVQRGGSDHAEDQGEAEGEAEDGDEGPTL